MGRAGNSKGAKGEFSDSVDRVGSSAQRGHPPGMLHALAPFTHEEPLKVLHKVVERDDEDSDGEEAEGLDELEVVGGSSMSSRYFSSSKVDKYSATSADEISDLESTQAGSEVFPWRREPAFLWKTRNSFVHFSEEDDELDKGASKPPEKPLPAPLDVLPGTTSLEKLEKYRLSYQAFRAGKSSGAKGEVSCSVDKEEISASSAPREHPAGVLHSVAPFTHEEPLKVLLKGVRT